MSYRLLATLLLSIVLATIVRPASGGERDQFFEAEDRLVKFKSTEDFFPVRLARPGSNILALELADLPDDFAITYEWEGETYTVDEFNHRTNTNALLILKGGKIVTEIYRNGATPATRFISFSTGKSFTSTLVGIAYEDGLIDDLKDPLTKYLPSLTGSAYDGVTIRDALQMSSGVEWDEATYD